MMSSENRCLYAAGGDSNSSPVNDSESNVAATSDRAFLIGVAGGTASGKVSLFSLLRLANMTIHLDRLHYRFTTKSLQVLHQQD